MFFDILVFKPNLCTIKVESEESFETSVLFVFNNIFCFEGFYVGVCRGENLRSYVAVGFGVLRPNIKAHFKNNQNMQTRFLCSYCG